MTNEDTGGDLYGGILNDVGNNLVICIHLFIHDHTKTFDKCAVFLYLIEVDVRSQIFVRNLTAWF